MYLKRNIDIKITNWIKKNTKKPLTIFGTRQSGKTTSVLEITKQNYKNVYYINLLYYKNDAAFDYFKSNPTFENLIRFLETIYNKQIELTKESVIIVDELQECIHFYTELKRINETIDFHNIICLGSYLGTKIFTDNVFVPVGQVESLDMYTMGFDEFLMNCYPTCYERILKAYKDKKISDLDHEIFKKAFEDYLIIGGFPEVVCKFIENNNQITFDVLEINKNINNEYFRDLSKYIDDSEKVKVELVYNNALLFAGKENNTFTLSTIKTNARYRDYEYAIQLLIKSNICYKIDNCKNLEFPIVKRDSSEKFKIYLCDIGLISGFYNLNQLNISQENFNNIKGNMIENYIISELKRYGYNPYYYTFKEKTNVYELDCVYTKDLVVNVLEIKSGKNKKSSSYNKIKESSNINKSITSLNNSFENNNTPLYMFFLTIKDN